LQDVVNILLEIRGPSSQKHLQTYVMQANSLVSLKILVRIIEFACFTPPKIYPRPFACGITYTMVYPTMDLSVTYVCSLHTLFNLIRNRPHVHVGAKVH
jgi:hypothetical protein